MQPLSGTESNLAMVRTPSKSVQEVVGLWRLKEPEQYTGKTLRDLKRFIARCKLAFQGRPAAFGRELEKVLYVASALDRDVLDTWNRHYFQMGDI